MSRPGFFFCICPDSNLIKLQIQNILVDHNPDDWETRNIWSDDPDLEDKLWQSLNLVNMMGPSRAVVIRKCEAFRDGLWTLLAPALKGFRPGIWPFFCLETAWDKNRPKIPPDLEKQKYYRIAREKKWLWQFPGLTRQNLPRYLHNRTREMGLDFAPGVKERLIQILPLDSHGVNREMEKLDLLAGEHKRVDLHHLDAVDPSINLDIFALMRMLQKGENTAGAWEKIFKDQVSGRDGLFPFLGLLHREARILWHLANNEQNKIFLFPGEKKEKTAMAGRLGREKIALLWNMIMEAEMGVKSGTVLPEQAMENLAANLCRLFRSGQD